MLLLYFQGWHKAKYELSTPEDAHDGSSKILIPTHSTWRNQVCGRIEDNFPIHKIKLECVWTNLT